MNKVENDIGQRLAFFNRSGHFTWFGPDPGPTGLKSSLWSRVDCKEPRSLIYRDFHLILFIDEATRCVTDTSGPAL